MPQMETQPNRDMDSLFSRAAALMLAGVDAETAAMSAPIGSLPAHGELVGKPREAVLEVPTSR